MTGREARVTALLHCSPCLIGRIYVDKGAFSIQHPEIGLHAGSDGIDRVQAAMSEERPSDEDLSSCRMHSSQVAPVSLRHDVTSRNHNQRFPMIRRHRDARSMYVVASCMLVEFGVGLAPGRCAVDSGKAPLISPKR